MTTTPTTSGLHKTIRCHFCEDIDTVSKPLIPEQRLILYEAEEIAETAGEYDLHIWYFCTGCSMRINRMIDDAKRFDEQRKEKEKEEALR